MHVLTVFAEEAANSIPMPPYVFGLVAFLVFLALGLVTWSYRDVANRHRLKTQDHPSGHGSDHADATETH